VFFTPLDKIRNYREALSVDDDAFYVFHEEMLKRGVYMHPDPFERTVISTAHNEEDAQKVLEAAKEAFHEVKIKIFS
jgi:Glutamate-1-semialdehyde aminotransferase